MKEEIIKKSGIFSVLMRIGLMWAVSIFFVVIVLISSVIISFREKSFMPFVTDLGGRVLTADAMAFTQIQEIKVQPQTWYAQEETFKAKSKAVWNRLINYILLLSAIWFLVMLWYVIFKLFMIRDTTNPFKNGIYAFFSLMIISIVFNLMMIAINSTEIRNKNPNYSTPYKDLGLAFLPLKGVYEVITNLDFLFGDLVLKIKQPLERIENVSDIIYQKV